MQANETGARAHPLLRPALVTSGFIALLLVTYSGVAFLDETFVLRDALRFTLPSREAFSAAVRTGHVPEWWDGVGFGVALAANPVHGVTSPLSWPFASWGTFRAFDVQTLVQLLILAAGTFLLARRLGATVPGAFLAGAVLVTSGYVVSAIPNGAVPYVAWIPWVSWAAIRAPRPEGSYRTRSVEILLFAAATALQLLSGEPGHTLVAALLVVMAVLSGERPLGRLRQLAVPAVAGLGLAAVGVLPALMHLGSSARWKGGPAAPLRWSMHPGRSLEWVWPLPFGSEGNESWFAGAALGLPPGDPFFSLSLFLGVPVLLLALAGGGDVRVRRLLLASSGFLLLALGSYTPLSGVLRAVFPPLRLVNFPEKFFFGALVVWCVAAGVGFSRVVSASTPRTWLVMASMASAILLALAGAAAYLERNLLASWLRPRAAGIDLTRGLTLSVTGAEIAAGGCALFALALLLSRRGASTPVVHGLAFAGILLPLLLAARAITPLAPRGLGRNPPRALATLPRSPLFQKDVRPRLFHFPSPHVRPPLATGPEIAADFHETLDANVAARFGYDVIPGFDPGDSSLSRRLWEEISPRMSFLAFVRLLGVDFALVPEPERFAPGLPVFSRLPGWGIVGTFPIRPRAFVAPRATVVPTRDAGLDSLAWPGRENDPARVVISGDGAEPLDARGPLEPCGVIAPRPEEIALDCRSSNGGYAVLLDENLQGWSAEMDGRPASILTADGLFRAVRVSPGSHHLAFRYRTPGLRAGAVISLLTCLTLALAFFAPTRPGHFPSSRHA